MDKYSVLISPRAYENIDNIYNYISRKLLATKSATDLVEKLEEAILSLEIMPQRFPQRRIGVYANKGYRQFFVNNFTVIYRVDESKKKVLVITVRYLKSDF